MCSRRARIRPSSLLDSSSSNPPIQVKLSSSSSNAANVVLSSSSTSATQSSKAAISPSAETPNGKRVRSWRRPTGPLSPEDLLMAMLETEKDQQGRSDGQQHAVFDSEISGDIEDDDHEQFTRENIFMTDCSLECCAAATVFDCGGGRGGGSGGGTPRIEQVFGGVAEKKPHSQSKKGIYQLTKMDSLILRQQQLIGPRKTSKEQLMIDYKKLFEIERAEKERLYQTIRELENLVQKENFHSTDDYCKKSPTLDVAFQIQTGEMTEMAKRIVKMEDELRALETLRADNQRLKEENGALIRVISRLSK